MAHDDEHVHYATFTPDADNDPDEWTGTFTFECAAPPSADCRWECDCEEWVVTMRGNEAWHVLDYDEDESHQMRPASCTIADWFDSGYMSAYLDPPRTGRHPIDCEWMGDGYVFTYNEEAQ